MNSLVNNDDLISALHSIDSSSGRDIWFRMLAAFKAGGGCKEGAREWSSWGSNYDPRDFENTWRSIDFSKGITERTLFKYARERGWVSGSYTRKVPERRQPIQTSQPPKTAQYAKNIWAHACEVNDTEGSHPYLLEKKITHAFGARRSTACGLLIGQDADCLVIPNRDWTGELVGVEVINPSGVKQTSGSKGVLILGHPEGANIIHITEGWASMWACFESFPKPHAGVVAFGKQRLSSVRRRLIVSPALSLSIWTVIITKISGICGQEQMPLSTSNRFWRGAHDF